MKKILLIPIVILILGLSMSACTPSQTGTSLQGQERDQVMAYGEPIADNLLQGLNAGDFAKFSRDFNSKMLQAIDEKKFQALAKDVDNKFGKYQSRSVNTVTDYGEMVTVNYKGIFSNADNVQILLTFTKSEPHQVTGLYFK